jgi:dephospho-CoA kinase
MKIIGLTGGIGSGKSAVAHYLETLGAAVIDADKVGHEVQEPHTPGWEKIVAEFGEQVLMPNGNIDRKKLAGIVFLDPGARAKLNGILHPEIYQAVKARLEKYRREGVLLVVLEAPLLIDAGWEGLVDEVWVVVTPQPTVIRRLQKTRGMSETEILARIKSQLSTEEKIKKADVILENNSSLEKLQVKVKKQWERIGKASD